LPEIEGYDDAHLIGHSATALVFRATQTRLNRLVAIKVITSDNGSVPANAERELATTVALSSQPHIVSIIDTGVTEDNRLYIVMEYCEGGSYGKILHRSGPMSVDDVIEVGIKIGEALHAAHEVGIIHRDVKPSNILRSRFGPALTDFGIARAPDELGGTLTREMMTPQYASPEALLHHTQSGLSDVYSLASTLWTLLVGHPPFADPSSQSRDVYHVGYRVLHEPPPPMPRKDVPTWLVSELTRAMSKLPSERHPSALEFAEALRRGALGLRPAAPRSAPAARPPTSPPTRVHLKRVGPPQARLAKRAPTHPNQEGRAVSSTTCSPRTVSVHHDGGHRHVAGRRRGRISTDD
jgi:serine/threonine protein kinase